MISSVSHLGSDAGVAPGAAPDRLQRARRLMEDGSIQPAMRLLHGLVRARPGAADGYLLRAQGFLVMGYPEEAARDLRWALQLQPDDGAIAAQLSAVEQQLAARLACCAARRHIDAFSVIRFLGTGWEGAVYLCKHPNGKRYVVKRFHPHRVDKINGPVGWYRRPVPAARPLIITLGETLQRHPHPLFFGYSALECEGRLGGLYYPYRNLLALRRAHLLEPGFRSALLRQALSGQAHLLETSGVLMSDLHPNQFMFQPSGRVRFIDYGASLLSTRDFRIEADRLHVLALIRLLAQLFAPREQVIFDGPETFHASPAQLQQRVDRSP
ncbi:MAG: tetratricopeptide repeat protein, partial [Pseudomonadales bacterium]